MEYTTDIAQTDFNQPVYLWEVPAFLSDVHKISILIWMQNSKVLDICTQFPKIPFIYSEAFFFIVMAVICNNFLLNVHYSQ